MSETIEARTSAQNIIDYLSQVDVKIVPVHELFITLGEDKPMEKFFQFNEVLKALLERGTISVIKLGGLQHVYLTTRFIDTSDTPAPAPDELAVARAACDSATKLTLELEAENEKLLAALDEISNLEYVELSPHQAAWNMRAIALQAIKKGSQP